MRKMIAKLTTVGLLSGLILTQANIAHAAPCETKVCIQVVTDPSTDQIVITAVQNKPGATSSPRPRPTIKRPYTPRPYTPRPYTPRPKPTIKVVKTTSTKKPIPKKAVSVKPKVVAAVSLSDRLTQLLPQRNIFYTPKNGAVVNVPMYFYTDATASFATTSMILGINVGVNLTPLFTWDFGDGTTYSTPLPGLPYPNTSISHTYKTSGTYKVVLTISWSGTWSAENNTYAVLGGNIVQSYSTNILISQAPTKFTK